jgi:hypothetical protein
MILKSTTLEPYGEVFLTEGMTMTSGRKIYGVFVSEDEAMSPHADRLTLAIINGQDLTSIQRITARHNSNAIADTFSA